MWLKSHLIKNSFTNASEDEDIAAALVCAIAIERPELLSFARAKKKERLALANSTPFSCNATCRDFKRIVLTIDLLSHAHMTTCFFEATCNLRLAHRRSLGATRSK